jgi:hypothetical protein
MADPNDPFARHVHPTWELFAGPRDTNLGHFIEAYRDYVAYRLACDKADMSGGPRPLTTPDVSAGDDYFEANFASRIAGIRPHARIRVDLRDFILQSLSVAHADVPITSLRGSQVGNRRLQKLREDLIRKAVASGYPSGKVAAFFVMSPSRVSVLYRRQR